MLPEGIIIITMTLASIICVSLITYISIMSEKAFSYSYKHKILYETDLEKYNKVIKQQSKRLFYLRLKLNILTVICKILDRSKKEK